MSFSKKLSLTGLSLGLLLITSCGKQSEAETASEPTTPEAETPKAYPDTPEAAIKMIAGEISKGDMGVIWEAMPATYQSDVNEIVALASTKLDPEIYDKTFTFFDRLADVADKQKNFIFNTQLGGEQPPEEKEKMENALPSVIALIKGLAGSEISTVEGLKTFDGQAFFDTTVSKMAEQLEEIAKLSGETEFSMSDLSEVAVSVVESEGDQATLELKVPNEESQIESFTKVEGRWVPTEMADGWVQSIADAKAEIEGVSVEEMAANKPQLLSVFAMLDGVLTQIDSAETQEQFDQALQGAMMPLMGLMMMSTGGGMSAPVTPTAP
ncbi:MAG: hypothetical protein AAF546_03570 [Verrucomicrobiota bacterium]